MHAAVAPIMVGKEGRSLFDKCATFLRSIARPHEKATSGGENPFAMLLLKAQMADAARKKAQK